MAEPSIHLEVALAETKLRILGLERDHERVVGTNTRTIEKHEKAIELLEEQTAQIRLEQAVSNAEIQGMSKLKWIIVIAIVTQLVTTLSAYQKPIETSGSIAAPK